MTARIRNAELKDIDEMVLLLKQLFAIEVDFTFNPKAHTRGLAMMLEGCGKHRAVKVAEIEGRVVGMVTAQTRISSASGSVAAGIEDLVIDREYRGRGLGGLLLGAIDEWAGKRGIKHLHLLADKDNTPALAFYKGRNWQTTNMIYLTLKR